MNERLQRRGRGDGMGISERNGVVVEKDTKVQEFCWKGRGDWCARRGRSGKQRRIMGKMRIEVTFSPSSAGYMPEFGKLCFHEGVSVFLFSQESQVGLVLVVLGLEPRCPEQEQRIPASPRAPLTGVAVGRLPIAEL